MSFDLVDPNGVVDVSAPGAAEAIRDDGFLRTLHLDANLTLDLANVGTGKLAPGRADVTEVVRFAVASDTAIDSDLGVEELSRGALRSSGDADRGSKLRRQIAAALRLVEQNLGLQPGTVSVAHLGRAEVNSYMRVHLGAYAHLLRIEQIAKQKPRKADALDNVAEYLRWANEVAKNITAYCLQVSLDVFGGEPRAARLLSVGSSKPQESRAWNAAWDIVHAFAMHEETSRPVGQRLKRAFLATRDQALSYVAQRCVVAVFVRSSPLGDMSIASMKIDQPFLLPQKAKVEKLLADSFAAQRRRIEVGDSASPRDIARIRDRLERELGIK